MSEAEDTVDLAIEYKEKYNGLVVGVDLSGDPKVSKILNVKCTGSVSSYPTS